MSRRKTSLIKQDKLHYDEKEREILNAKLTTVVNDFLKNTSQYFKGWSISEIISKADSVSFVIDSTNPHNCALTSDHYREVSTYLPLFILRAPIGRAFGHYASSVRTCELEYDVTRGEKQYKKHKLTQFGVGGFFVVACLALVLLVGLFIKHTESDADRFASLWQGSLGEF